MAGYLIMAALVGCNVGVGLGFGLTKRLRERIWRTGFGCGVGVLASVIRRGAPMGTDERFGQIYKLPVDGLDRVETAAAKEAAAYWKMSQEGTQTN